MSTMSTTLAPDMHVAGGAELRAPVLDSGARLSYALLSYLVVLIAALSLLPFEFSTPSSVRFSAEFAPWSTIGSFAMFIPYGFLTRRARVGRIGSHFLTVALSASVLAVALETVRMFEPRCVVSVWHVVASMVGASIGAGLCARLHDDRYGASSTVYALLLQLPLMGLMYLLIPLLWATAASAHGDPHRLALTLCIGLMGASILGSIAKATRAYTPNRPWWAVSAIALVWVGTGTLPFVMVGWQYTLAIIGIVVVCAAWRGRWSAPMFQDRRYEVPALLAAAPFLVLYQIGAGIWPAEGFRTIPLVHLGLPLTESGLTIALPLLEAGISATILGYIVAEFYGRREGSLRASLPTILGWASLMIIVVETTRSFFGYEGASLVRAAMSLCTATYGAALYHLQRDHVKVVARRVRNAR
jgi:VanZ family protein